MVYLTNILNIVHKILAQISFLIFRGLPLKYNYSVLEIVSIPIFVDLEKFSTMW